MEMTNSFDFTFFYSGTYKSTGKHVRAQFAHIWSVREGRVVRFQQYTDTKQFADTVAG
jgi:ketosteroid isomerase-like protein